jgi:hypothetical protein
MSHHSAAVTDRGALFTWWEDELSCEMDGPVGLGYPETHDLACRRPGRVEALGGVRIVSVVAGCDFTDAVTDTGTCLKSVNNGEGVKNGEGVNDGDGVNHREARKAQQEVRKATEGGPHALWQAR